MTDRVNAVVEAIGSPRLLKVMEHNRWLIVAIILIGALVASCTFLRPTVPHPFDPMAPPINRADLQMISARWAAETEAQAKMLTATDEALKAREAWIEEVIATVEPLAVSAAGPYGSIVTMGFGLLAGGLFMDNRRKGQIIKKTNGNVPSV